MPNPDINRPARYDLVPERSGTGGRTGQTRDGGNNSLVDVLERVLDKGLVVAGDIRINLLDIELLTIKVRLLIASVDKAREMGIDWWAHDPHLNSKSESEPKKLPDVDQKKLSDRMDRIESQLGQLLERVAPAKKSARSARAGAGHGPAKR
jgi:hypothetical protein